VTNPENLIKQQEKMKAGLAAEIGSIGGQNKKGSKHINTWVQEILEDPAFEAKIRIGFEIKDFKGAPVKAIIQAQMIKAIEGDTNAYNALVKSGYVQKLEQENTGEQTITVITRKYDAESDD
jgi:hypothetical protein